MALTKITKIGGSLGVILDKSITTEIFGWDENTPIEVKYDEIGKCIIIRKNGNGR